MLLMLGGGDTFSPRSFANLKLWLDASNLSSITKDGSNNVTAWNDISGSGNHVGSVDVVGSILYNATGLNGNPTVTAINAEGIITDDPDFNLANSECFIFGVWNNDADNDVQGRIFWDWGAAGQRSFNIFSDNTANNRLTTQVTTNGTTITNVLVSPIPTVGTPYFYTLDIDPATGISTVRINNTVAATGAVYRQSDVTGNIFVFNKIAGAVHSISELGFCTSLPTAAQRAALWQYVQDKWGIS